MPSFEQLKEKFGIQPIPPTPLPNFEVYCHQCGRKTRTKVFHMKAGLGNGCALCGAFRKGWPYLSKVEFKNLLELATAKGGNRESICVD